MFPNTTSVLFLNTSRVGSSTTLHSLFQYLCWIRHIWTYPIYLFYPDSIQCFSAPEQISTLIQLCFMWKYNEDTLNSFINIFDKNIKQDWAPKLRFGNAFVTGCQLDLPPLKMALGAWSYSQVFAQCTVHSSKIQAERESCWKQHSHFLLSTKWVMS